MLKTPIRNQTVYTARNIFAIIVTSVKKSADLDQTRRRRRCGAAGLGLHFLPTSEGPFSHDAVHLYYVVKYKIKQYVFLIDEFKGVVWNHFRIK